MQGPFPYDKASGAEWKTIGGAPALIDSSGQILAACDGLEDYDVDELDETRDERDARQQAAEAAGWEPRETREARATWRRAKAEAAAGGHDGLVLVRIGDTHYAFDDDAAHLHDLLDMGDGQTASFDHDHLETHLGRLIRAGHRVALADRAADGRPQESDHSAKLDDAHQEAHEELQEEADEGYGDAYEGDGELADTSFDFGVQDAPGETPLGDLAGDFEGADTSFDFGADDAAESLEPAETADQAGEPPAQATADDSQPDPEEQRPAGPKTTEEHVADVIARLRAMDSGRRDKMPSDLDVAPAEPFFDPHTKDLVWFSGQRQEPPEPEPPPIVATSATPAPPPSEEPIDLEAVDETPRRLSIDERARVLPMIPGPVGDAIRALHGTSEVRLSGRTDDADFTHSYASRIYRHLQSVAREGDGFGDVYDLSSELGPGAVGYASPAGLFAMVPPRFRRQRWDVRYAAITPHHLVGMPRSTGQDTDKPNKPQKAPREPKAPPVVGSAPAVPPKPPKPEKPAKPGRIRPHAAVGITPDSSDEDLRQAMSAIPSQVPDPAHDVESFTTSQGSTYTVSGKSTQRTKTPHLGHDANDVGPKRPSDATVFVSAIDGQRVGSHMTLQGTKPRVAIINGKLMLLSRNAQTGKWGTHGAPITFSTTPKVGMAPVEFWGDRTVHAGNTITEVKRKPKPPRTLNPQSPEPSSASEPKPRSDKPKYTRSEQLLRGKIGGITQDPEEQQRIFDTAKELHSIRAEEMEQRRQVRRDALSGRSPAEAAAFVRVVQNLLAKGGDDDSLLKTPHGRIFDQLLHRAMNEYPHLIGGPDPAYKLMELLATPASELATPPLHSDDSIAEAMEYLSAQSQRAQQPSRWTAEEAAALDALPFALSRETVVRYRRWTRDKLSRCRAAMRFAKKWDDAKLAASRSPQSRTPRQPAWRSALSVESPRPVERAG